MTVQMDQLFLYARAGCDLCDEARLILDGVLRERAAAGRPSPAVVERDIDSNEAWQHAFMATIPVIEFGGRQLELAASPARIRRLLADVLDVSPATT
jgi:hypothetical protein